MFHSSVLVCAHILVSMSQKILIFSKYLSLFFFLIYIVEKVCASWCMGGCIVTSKTWMNHFPFAAPLLYFIFPDTENTAEKASLIKIYSQPDSLIWSSSLKIHVLHTPLQSCFMFIEVHMQSSNLDGYLMTNSSAKFEKWCFVWQSIFFAHPTLIIIIIKLWNLLLLSPCSSQPNKKIPLHFHWWFHIRASIFGKSSLETCRENNRQK